MSSDSDHSGLPGEFGSSGASGESEYSDFHRSTRMPLDAVVRLHFEGTVAYQNGFAANVSATGMYVKHPDPPPLGTRLVFELVLGEERKPVQGAGVVAWSREKYEGPGRPAGIGIQYTEVDALSRQHIAEALFSFLEMQLGDELAESQDVVDLVATTSTRSPVDLIASFTPLPEQEAPARARFTTPTSPLAPITPFIPQNSTRDAESALLDAPLFRRADGASPAASSTTEGGLFTPEIPPDDLLEIRAAARRRAKSPWPAVAIGVAIAGAAFAGWWFLAGPGSLGSSATTPSESDQAAVGQQAAPPARPALSPTLSADPGSETTLAQAVGAEAVQAPEPLPVDSSPAPEAGESETEATPKTTPETATETIASAPVEPAPAAIASPAPGARASSEAAAARMSRVTTIDWEEASGLTVVVLTGDGGFPAGSYKWNEIRDANPRVLLRLTQMSAGYPRTLLAAGTPELKQLRIGYHEKPAGNELHVVLDLAAADVTVASVEASGNRLYIRLARP